MNYPDIKTEQDALRVYNDLMESGHNPSLQGILNMLEESAERREQGKDDLCERLRDAGLHPNEAKLLHHLNEGEQEQ